MANIKIKSGVAIQKKKTARELMMEDIKQYLQRPNQKLLKELRDKAMDLNINFDQLLNKAKEEVMKEKATLKKENPANIDVKLAKRVQNGSKLIE